MYLPSHFEETRAETLHALIRSHPLGTLITQDRSGALQADPIPFILDAGPQDVGTLRGHVARANPLWRETREDVDALVVFQGAQGYISPSWYPAKAEHGKVVPTWNYIVVQARGRLRAIDDREWLRAFVTRLDADLATIRHDLIHADGRADFQHEVVGLDVMERAMRVRNQK